MKSKNLVMIATIVIAGVSYIGCKSKEETMPQIDTTKSGLQTQILKEAPAKSVQAQPGRNVTVHYTGWLLDKTHPELKGKKFDSSVDRGQPFQFNLGAGMVIRGWDEGVALMKVGEKRRLIIPASLAYGNRSVGNLIPANSTLVFDVELLQVS